MPESSHPPSWDYKQSDAIRLYRMGVPEDQIISDLMRLYSPLSRVEAAVLYGRAKDLVDHAREQTMLGFEEPFFLPTMPALPEVPAGMIQVELEWQVPLTSGEGTRRIFLRELLPEGASQHDLFLKMLDLIHDLAAKYPLAEDFLTSTVEFITIARHP